MFGFSRKKQRSPPTSGDEEAEKRHQPHMDRFYSDINLNPDNVDGLLRDEMMQLGVGNRNNICEEIHGVRCMAPLETPQLLEQSLRELDDELARIPLSEKPAFCHASNQNQNHSHSHTETKKNYVDTDEFRLRFLRCELFDAKKAARRLVNYLDLIAYCLPFEKGLAVLQRPITLSDFSQKEKSILQKGHLQLLPFRDRSGRRVITNVASLGIRFDPHMWYKIVLYFLLVAGDDIESQQKGIIVLAWPNPDIAESFKLQYPINSGGRLVQMILQCVPVRVTAFHFCTPENDPFFKVVRSVFALSLGGKRSRLKFHSGKPTELRYQISSYGIPVDLLPLTSTGNVKTTYLKQWIRLRNSIEEDIVANGFQSTSTSTSEDSIECPGTSDVIFRPGRPVMNHPGNVTFRSLIESKSYQHDIATQTEKLAITKEVVDEMIEVREGRFLTWDENSGCWKAIRSSNKQRHKVAIAFRNFKSYKKALRNCQTNDATAMATAFRKLDHGNGGDNEADDKKRRHACIHGPGSACS